MNILIGFLIGFLVAEIIAGRKKGRTRYFKSWILHYKNYFIHIHHWMWSAALLAVAVSLSANGWIIGILLGICIQGLSAPEFYKIIYQGEK